MSPRDASCRRQPGFCITPPWRQPRGKWMVSLVNSHTNATSRRWHLWEIDLRFAPELPPGWRSGDGIAWDASMRRCIAASTLCLEPNVSDFSFQGKASFLKRGKKFTSGCWWELVRLNAVPRTECRKILREAASQTWKGSPGTKSADRFPSPSISNSAQERRIFKKQIPHIGRRARRVLISLLFAPLS